VRATAIKAVNISSNTKLQFSIASDSNSNPSMAQAKQIFLLHQMQATAIKAVSGSSNTKYQLRATAIKAVSSSSNPKYQLRATAIKAVNGSSSTKHQLRATAKPSMTQRVSPASHTYHIPHVLRPLQH
jgi:hypothetical protein